MRPSSKTVCVPLAMSRATAICRSPVQHYRKLVGLRGNTPGTCTPHCSGRSCLCAERYPMAGMDVVLAPCLHHCDRARWRMRTARASASVES
jgi:hypothetical protein